MTDDTRVETTDTVETGHTETTPTAAKESPNIRDHDDAIKALRRENEKLRKTLHETSAARAEELANQKLEALRQEVEAKATANSKELFEKALADREDAARSRQVRQELRHHAEKEGVADFTDLYEVMKKDLSKVTFDDDGEVANAAELIAEIKMKKPHLFVQVNTSNNAISPPERLSTKTDFKSMPKDDFNQYLRSLGVAIPGLR